jgi:hypothetical protein
MLHVTGKVMALHTSTFNLEHGCHKKMDLGQYVEMGLRFCILVGSQITPLLLVHIQKSKTIDGIPEGQN